MINRSQLWRIRTCGASSQKVVNLIADASVAVDANKDTLTIYLKTSLEAIVVLASRNKGWTDAIPSRPSRSATEAAAMSGLCPYISVMLELGEESVMVNSAPGASKPGQKVRPSWRSQKVFTATVVLIAGSGLAFDVLTPAIVSVGIFYVAMVLLGFSSPQPKASLGLAALATPLIIVGHWITIPDNTPTWELGLNRAIAIGAVWLTAWFVWRIRLLNQDLRRQIEIVDSLSREINHRVGNQLQLVASFLELQARATCNEETCRVLRLAVSRVETIGSIQRMLSHNTHAQMIETEPFFTELVDSVRSALPDPQRIEIIVRVDAAKLTATIAATWGAMLMELMNNALKHAFTERMCGRLVVNFEVCDNKYILLLEDDGVGTNTNEEEISSGFGTRSISGLARAMGGSATCQPARDSQTRPGTRWKVVAPA